MSAPHAEQYDEPDRPALRAVHDPIAEGIAALRAVPDDLYIDRREGLQTKQAAQAIQRTITYGWNPQEERFYTYAHGVWTNGDNAIKQAVTALFGDRYRGAIANNVLAVLPHLADVRRIDAEPVGANEWINVRNGLVNWRKGTLHAHHADRAGVIQLGCAWDNTAECPTFSQFLTEVLPEDCIEPSDECPQGFIWEVIGYAIFTGNPLQVAFMLHGGGGNGKGRFLHVLERLAGPRNVSSVGLHELVGNRFRAATLYGKLLNIAGDLDAKWLEDTAIFKKFTGSDTVQAEHKFGQPFDFRPYATPFYSVNEPFGSADQSEGYWRRWVVLPFPHSHRDSCKTTTEIDAANTTDAELSGILRRAVAALAVLMDRGRFAEPESVRKAKEEFREHGDKVHGWLREHAELDRDITFTPRTVLYESFKRFCEEETSRPLAASKFYGRLAQLPGVYDHKLSGTRGFEGIRVRS